MRLLTARKYRSRSAEEWRNPERRSSHGQQAGETRACARHSHVGDKVGCEPLVGIKQLASAA